MPNFFKRLSYSFGNEDWLTEKEALQIQPNNRVLCITASGDRPLHLLLNNCQEIVSIDANSVQNYLLDLKMQAMQHLEFNEYLAFLGVMASATRKETLKKMMPYLTPEAAHFWTEHPTLIYNGVIYQGAMERWLRKLSFIIRVARSKEIQNLFSAKNIEEQRAYIQTHWNHSLWKSAFKLVMNPWVTRFFFKDPGVYAHLDCNYRPAEYLYQRMISSLERHPARQNALISLILLGKVPLEAMPPYLQAGPIETIKPLLPRLTIQTKDVVSYLESAPENSFDRYSLSDVASYLDHAAFLRLLKAMYRTAKPGARFCMRQLMTRYKIPEGLKPYFARELDLEEKLEANERAFVYHFTVGKILKD